MARIYPFRAWRYNPSAVRLADAVTPPRALITSAMQQALYQRSPYNLVRILLGLPELFDAERGESAQTRAARDFEAWRSQGVLAQEKDPCIFACAQRFTVPGTAVVKERRSFVALGRLHEHAEKVVYPLQQPAAALVEESLALLRATSAQLEPVTMLYNDPAGSVEQILFDRNFGGGAGGGFDHGNGPADAEITDEHGVLHRLWKIADPVSINLLTTAMADKRLILAEGQHWYEAALRYKREQPSPATARAESAAAHLPQPEFPAAAALMHFVSMDAEGLEIAQTKPTTQGSAPWAAEQLRKAAFAGETMPAGSIDFYPKLLNGLVIYALD